MDFANFNFHPPLASFPAPLLIVTALLEIAQIFARRVWINRASMVCLGLAVLFAALAFFTGYSASEHADKTFKIPDQVIALHHTIGRALLFALVPCFALHFISQRAVYGAVAFRVIYLTLLALCVALVVYTGYLGGLLVFEYGAGVGALLR